MGAQGWTLYAQVQVRHIQFPLLLGADEIAIRRVSTMAECNVSPVRLTEYPFRYDRVPTSSR